MHQSLYPMMVTGGYERVIEFAKLGARSYS